MNDDSETISDILRNRTAYEAKNANILFIPACYAGSASRK